MKITITLSQFGRRSRVVTTNISERVTLEMLRKLWEAEQTLNSIPGANLRVHISVDEEVTSLLPTKEDL